MEGNTSFYFTVYLHKTKTNMATFREVILTGAGQIRADGYANVKIKVQQGRIHQGKEV